MTDLNAKTEKYKANYQHKKNQKKSLGQNKVLIRGIGILARTWNPEARCANLKIKLMCIFNAGIKSVS